MFSQRVPQSKTMHDINYIILDYMGRWTYEESFLLGRTLQVKVMAKTVCWAEEWWSATSFLSGSVCCCCCWSAPSAAGRPLLLSPPAACADWLCPESSLALPICAMPLFEKKISKRLYLDICRKV